MTVDLGYIPVISGLKKVIDVFFEFEKRNAYVLPLLDTIRAGSCCIPYTARDATESIRIYYGKNSLDIDQTVPRLHVRWALAKPARQYKIDEAIDGCGCSTTVVRGKQATRDSSSRRSPALVSTLSLSITLS